MKKLIFILFLFFTASSLFAQLRYSDALGLRAGDSKGLMFEISYQHRLAEQRRIEIDIGFRNQSNKNDIKLTVLHQWVWNISGAFDFFAGAGAGIGSWYNKNDSTDVDDGFFMNIDGNAGVEYDFSIPLQIALDFRPEFEVFGYYNDADLNFALSLRYQFY